MSNASVSVFNFDGQSLNVVLDEQGNPWFVANEVCAALELANPRDAVTRHADPDDVGFTDIIDSMGRNQKVNAVNESGLYALIFGSRKEAAKRFKKWVTSEVLPQIRKTGSYRAEEQADTLPNGRKPYPEPVQMMFRLLEAKGREVDARGELFDVQEKIFEKAQEAFDLQLKAEAAKSDQAEAEAKELAAHMEVLQARLTSVEAELALQAVASELLSLKEQSLELHAAELRAKEASLLEAERLNNAQLDFRPTSSSRTRYRDSAMWVTGRA